jgi:hypothetical protein
MTRIVQEEKQRGICEGGSPERISEERVREIDPNRARISGREHWQNRTRGSWTGR